MTWLYLLPAGSLLVLLLVAAGAAGQRHQLMQEVKSMALSNPILVDIFNAVKTEASALLARAEKAEADLAAEVAKSGGLESELAELKAELVAAVNPPASEPAPAA